MAHKPGPDGAGLGTTCLRQVALGAALRQIKARRIAQSGIGAGVPQQHHTAVALRLPLPKLREQFGGWRHRLRQRSGSARQSRHPRPGQRSPTQMTALHARSFQFRLNASMDRLRYITSRVM